MFAQLYNCANCGQIWHTEPYDIIDTERDDVETVMICSVCFMIVEPIFEDGKPVYHALTEEEAYWDNFEPETYE